MHYKHTCYKCLACGSKIGFILHLIMGSSVGCPLNCPVFPYLKVVGFPLTCPLTCPLYPYMEVVGNLICMQNYNEQPIPLPTELPTLFIFGRSGLPTELPTVSIYGRGGQSYLHDKIPIGSPLRCPRSCPLFHIWKQWAAQ